MFLVIFMNKKLYLISELILDNDNDIEINKRLDFCDFNRKIKCSLIAFEKKITTSKKCNSPLLIKRKWWDNNKQIVTPEIQYFSFDKKISTKLLSFSELVSIFDEADYILQNKDDYDVEIINNAMMLHDRRLKEAIINEIIYRFNHFYIENNLSFDNKELNKVMRLIINESHIIFLNKYNYHQNIHYWKPYTTDYYKYHSN